MFFLLHSSLLLHAASYRLVGLTSGAIPGGFGQPGNDGIPRVIIGGGIRDECGHSQVSTIGQSDDAESLIAEVMPLRVPPVPVLCATTFQRAMEGRKTGQSTNLDRIRKFNGDFIRFKQLRQSSYVD